MKLIDTHTHLDADDFQDDRAQVVAGAAELGIATMLIPNVDASTADAVRATCQAFPESCFPMMGVHPTSVKEDYETELTLAERLLAQKTFVAVGEIGIDLYWDRSFFAEQKIAFVRQMHWARDLHLPAVIHSRKSLEEILQLIRLEELQDVRAVFHCFPGSVEQAIRLADAGYKLGIGGVVTFKNATLAEVVRSVPLESLVLETDAPWLAPVPHRGKRNEPSYIRLIAAKVAEIRGISIEEVASATTTAARELFSTLPEESAA